MTSTEDILTKFKSIIGNDCYDDLHKLYQKKSKGYEFEFIFGKFCGDSLSYEKYLLLLKNLKIRSTKNKWLLTQSDTLDVSYSEMTNESDKSFDIYRISIEGMDNINTYTQMFNMRNNHVIMKILGTFLKEKKDKNLSGMIKKKNYTDDSVEISELGIKGRLAKETEFTSENIEKMANLERNNNIRFRLKNRVTLYVHGDDKSDSFVKIDLTITKMSNNITRLSKSIPEYELEIECGDDDNDKKKKETFLTMVTELMRMMKVIQDSNHIITVSEHTKVVDFYKLLLKKDKLTSLDGRNPKTLEIQYILEHLPNNYAVTDKADGKRHMLLIYNKRVYLLSQHLRVKYAGIILKDDKYDGTLFDGELIFISGKKNRHIFLVFDCLFVGGSDMRTLIKLFDRLYEADNVISSIFVFDNQKGYTFEKVELKGEFKLDTILESHNKMIDKYINNLNYDIDIEKDKPLIRRKYFIGAEGGKPWEIFAYSSLLYKKYTEDPNIKCPYMLDGLIFQPLDQSYVTSQELSSFSDYKWKPPQQNSIDFYITYEKDKRTGKLLNVYDNSTADEDTLKNQLYRICNLHVGQQVKFHDKTGEQPILFKKEEQLHEAHIFLDKGEVRDLEGNIVQDETVVEFYYNNDADVEPKKRWVPMRTRYDKTEAVVKYGKSYGNYASVATSIWRSIINPILIGDFDELAKGDESYNNKADNIRSKIGHELIITYAKENSYFSIKSNLAKESHKFSNDIKSNIIYSYCHPSYFEGKSSTILDLGVGRGADLMKFYNAQSDYCVCIDIDREALFSKGDGAISRYTQHVKSYARFPKMYFIQADCGNQLDFEVQKKLNYNFTEDERKTYERFFNPDPKKKIKFDRINCQLTFHYFLKNEFTWKNILENLNNHLKPGGFMMMSCFDGKRAADMLKDNPVISTYYTNAKGEKKLLYEVKRYEDFGNPPYGLGKSIDVHMAWMFREGQYETEYLVDADFLVSELDKHCDMELVETDTFTNQYEIQREYLMNYYSFNNEKTTKTLGDIRRFYEHSEINANMIKWNRLQRYYVFKKRDEVIMNVQKGGVNPRVCNELSKLMRDSNVFVHETKSLNDTLCESLHGVLLTHGTIPMTIPLKEFKDTYQVDVKDREFANDNDKIKRLANKIYIEHVDENNKKKVVLKGLNVIYIQNDKDLYTIDFLDNKASKNVVILNRQNKYHPIYFNKNGYRGIFSNNSPFIMDLKELIN